MTTLGVTPVLLDGQTSPGLWDTLAVQINTRGFQIVGAPNKAVLGGANGVTDYRARTVAVRTDMPMSPRVKTLAHDLLTAPAGVP